MAAARNSPSGLLFFGLAGLQNLAAPVQRRVVGPDLVHQLAMGLQPFNDLFWRKAGLTPQLFHCGWSSLL